jgi:DNA repair exonuclease SbcCD ATPase subunit
LKGNSGDGKTTIINAIAWCFYGIIKKIEPNVAFEGKTFVKISFGDFVILRSKPKRLVVTTKGKSYDGITAQELINSKFGSHDMWTISSNFRQCIRNIFLTSPVTARMDYLNLFAFKSENPPEYLKKLAVKSSKTLTEYEMHSKTYQKLLGEYEKYQVSSSDVRDEEELKKRIEEGIEKLKVLEKQEMKRRMQIDRLDTLNQALSKLSKPVEPIDPEVEETEEELEEKIRITKLHDAFYKKYPAPLVEPQKRVEESELELAQINFGIWSQNKKRLDVIGVEYDRKVIETEVGKIEQTLADQEYLKTKDELEQVEEDLENLKKEVEISDVRPTSEIETLEKERILLEAQLNYKKSIPCPECETTLHVVISNNDISLKTGPAENNVKERLREIKPKLTSLYSIRESQEKERARSEKVKIKIESLEKTAKDLKIHLFSLPEPKIEKLLSEKGVETYKNKLKVMKEINYIKEPKLAELKQFMQQGRLYDQYVKDLSELEAIKDEKVELVELYLLLDTLRKYKTNLQKYQSMVQVYEEKSKIYTEEIKSISINPDKSTEIQSLKEQITNDQTGLVKSQEANKMILLYEEIKEMAQMMSNEYGDIGSIDNLKLVMEWAEKVALQEAVEGINETVNKICEELFDQDISFELKLEKENKINKRIKRGIEVKVHMNNGTLDFEQISWGEADRVSLAMTFAFNRFSSFPLITMDEAFAFIQSALKNRGVELMKETVFCPILVTGQGFVEGMFDHVVDLVNHEKGRI